MVTVTSLMTSPRLGVILRSAFETYRRPSRSTAPTYCSCPSGYKYSVARPSLSERLPSVQIPSPPDSTRLRRKCLPAADLGSFNPHPHRCERIQRQYGTFDVAVLDFDLHASHTAIAPQVEGEVGSQVILAGTHLFDHKVPLASVVAIGPHSNQPSRILNPLRSEKVGEAFTLPLT